MGQRSAVFVGLPDHQSHCCVWTGFRQDTKGRVYVHGKGYGRINLWVKLSDGTSGSRKFITHRIAMVLFEISTIKPDFDFSDEADNAQFWALFQAYSTLGLTIDHVCECEPCLNPFHLQWVTIQRNLNFRSAYGEEGRSDLKKKIRHVERLLDANSLRQWVAYLRSNKFKSEIRSHDWRAEMLAMFYIICVKIRICKSIINI